MTITPRFHRQSDGQKTEKRSLLLCCALPLAGIPPAILTLLMLRSASTLTSLKVRFHKRPRSDPKRSLQRDWIRPALQLQLLQFHLPQSVIRVGHAPRNSYSVTVPFPHCTTQPQSVILNCNNCNVTPTTTSNPINQEKTTFPKNISKLH